MEHGYDTQAAGPGGWLQAAGISVMVAAALATVLFGTPAMSEGSTDGSCRLDLVAQEWTGSACDDVAAESATR